MEVAYIWLVYGEQDTECKQCGKGLRQCQSKDITEILTRTTRRPPRIIRRCWRTGSCLIVFDVSDAAPSGEASSDLCRDLTAKKEEPKTAAAQAASAAKAAPAPAANAQPDAAQTAARRQPRPRRLPPRAGSARQAHCHAAADHPRAGKEDRGYPQVHQRQSRQV